MDLRDVAVEQHSELLRLMRRSPDQLSVVDLDCLSTQRLFVSR
ncbi:hypothetical protein HD597_000676 [Nonomuraea thailandensis]|uniref:Uncharacterized protein n=1 Tax=Nonomuraea thailandensis TaxID=1188745 RepID=A0A9X2GE26_9ACTN|nr:hypothetical protein [Nonomuraea thailandensis]MCP2353656.1 hypothetical protein [Nonomuraea thailandensis]